MRLSKTVADLMNEQVNHELNAAYIYLGMASYFDGEGLSGFANWFRGHALEEKDHAMKLYDFLVANNVKVVLTALEAPSVDYDSPEDAITKALRHEESVTDLIKKLFGAAMEAGEYTAQPLLHWFLAEQVEEEDVFSTRLEEVQAVVDRFQLLMLDRQLGEEAAATAAQSPVAEPA